MNKIVRIIDDITILDSQMRNHITREMNTRKIIIDYSIECILHILEIIELSYGATIPKYIVFILNECKNDERTLNDSEMNYIVSDLDNIVAYLTHIKNMTVTDNDMKQTTFITDIEKLLSVDIISERNKLPWNDDYHFDIGVLGNKYKIVDVLSFHVGTNNPMRNKT